VARSIAIVAGIVAFSLLIGSAGYHYLDDLPWIDALLNASMILAGMGPVDSVKSTAAKLFAALYALCIPSTDRYSAIACVLVTAW
jgi:hypothetical protein